MVSQSGWYSKSMGEEPPLEGRNGSNGSQEHEALSILEFYVNLINWNNLWLLERYNTRPVTGVDSAIKA